MCIIIDTNTFIPVFDSTCSKHDEFKPVLDWIINGKGKIIYGGTTYHKELLRAVKIRKIFSILKSKSNKVVVVDQMLVDNEERRIHNLIPDKDFDDPHLAAIVSVSKCQLICSDDTRSIKYVTRPDIYPKGISTPKYYTGNRNANLLSDEYIDERYKPLNKCSKKVIGVIESGLSNIKKIDLLDNLKYN